MFFFLHYLISYDIRTVYVYKISNLSAEFFYNSKINYSPFDIFHTSRNIPQEMHIDSVLVNLKIIIISGLYKLILIKKKRLESYRKLL